MTREEICAMTNEDWEALLDKPRIDADLNKGGAPDSEGFFTVPLTTIGTQNSMAKQGLTFQEGMTMDFWTDDGDENFDPDPILFSGTVHYSPMGFWYARCNDKDVKHASEIK